MVVSQTRLTHGFLDGAPPLSASHHAPVVGAPARNIAYVVCLPLHLDLIQSHRSMRVCAELLGVAYVGIGDVKAAAAAFQTGLDRERKRNAQSDLCGTLMRRLSAI